MKKSRLFFSAFLFLLSSAVFSEEIWSTNTRLFSENKRFYAVLSRKASKTTELMMYEAQGDRELWSTWIEWERGSDGFVSNDGKVFVLINNDYTTKHNIVLVYGQNKQEGYSVKSILLGREYLRNDSGKIRWLDITDRTVWFTYGEDGAVKAMNMELLDQRVISISLE